MSEALNVYEITSEEDSDANSNDFLTGKSFEILLSILSGSRGIREISRELNMPVFTIQYYIKQLLTAKLIRVVETKVIDGRIENYYELASTDTEIMNYIRAKGQVDEKTNLDLSAQQFSTMTKNMIKNIYDHKDKTNKVKAYFIKTSEESMRAFKEELELLYKKYQELEDFEASDTYGLISVLAPYKINEESKY